jgi:hypothetical protein
VSAHFRAQLLRWARAAAVAFAPLMIAYGGRWPGWDVIYPVLFGLLEPGVRQVKKVQPATSDSAP